MRRKLADLLLLLQVLCTQLLDMAVVSSVCEVIIPFLAVGPDLFARWGIYVARRKPIALPLDRHGYTL